MSEIDIKQLLDGETPFYPQTDIHGLVNNGEYAIDEIPTIDSSNLVTSGGVASELALGAVYDVTAHNGSAQFASLQALLTDPNLNTLIPTNIRRGGMSIKFVSDNKYMQYRLMTATWSTKVANWQGVDDEPTPKSDNLVKSGGVYNSTPTIAGSSVESDLDISDEDGFVLMRLDNGHIKTKNFDSSKSVEVENELNSNQDLDISDEQGNVLMRLANGHIKTKNFDSSEITPGNHLIGLKVLIVGDSIAYGQGLDNPSAQRWGQQLADRYSWNCTISASSGAPIAFGSSQYGTSESRLCIAKLLGERLKSMQSAPPDLIIIEGGTNDMGAQAKQSPYGSFEDVTEYTDDYITSKADKTSFCGALRYMAELCRYYAPNAKVFQLTLEIFKNHNPFNTMPLSPDKTREDVDNAIRRSCHLYGLECIDFGCCGINWGNISQVASDTIHPNLLGTAQIVNYISRQLESRFVKFTNL